MGFTYHGVSDDSTQKKGATPLQNGALAIYLLAGRSTLTHSYL